jgi:NTE family protein
MPFGSEGVEDGIGLALSGGGFRATLFHLGAIRRLNELGVLYLLDRVSRVSGGSILAGLLGARWARLRFEGGVATNLLEEIESPLRLFCSRKIDIGAALLGLIPGVSAARLVRDVYDELYEGRTLQDLPDKPRFVFNSTSFQTGSSFRFSRPYAGDYRVGLIRNPTFRLAEAVAASSAFPPFLSPLRLRIDPESWERVKGAYLFDEIEYRRRLVLTDGGVYDNLGLETVWNRYTTLLVSDAGSPFLTITRASGLWLLQALRSLNLIGNQARILRRRSVIGDFVTGLRRGTYWGTDYDAEDQLADPLPVDPEKKKALARTRTRLNHFSRQEQGELINLGYALCDRAIRWFIPVIAGPAPPRWPDPQYELGYS